MKRIIVLILLLHLFLANRCVTKEMRSNTITVDNQLSEEVFLLPFNIKYDYYNVMDTKEGIVQLCN